MLAIAVDSHDRPGVCILDPACPEVQFFRTEALLGDPFL